MQAALTGLRASTQYFFRLDTTSDLSGTTHGQQQSFTTPASGQTTSPLTLSSTSLPHATFGTPYTASLTASGGAPIYTWKLTNGSLPAGLGLAANSGSISGTPTAVGTSHFTATVTDVSTPTPQTASEALSITVDPATTSARLTTSANPVKPRHAVSYSATVSLGTPGSGVPTGKVTFSNDRAPIRCAGGSQTLNSAGVATCTISYSAPGTHTITATYLGGASFAGSGSQTLSETVR